MISQETPHGQKLAILAIVAAVILLIGHELKLYLPTVEIWIQGLGVFAPLGFILVFLVLAPAFVSIDALCFAAGVLFPVVTGELTIIIATYLSAAILFYLGRDLARERIKAFISGHPRLAALDQVLCGENAFKLMFLLRLTPMPFAPLSYALSVTQVEFWPYLVSTSGILIYNGTLVYMGYLTKHLSAAMGGATTTPTISYPLLAAGLLILVVVLIYAAKLAVKALQELTPEDFQR